jgi:solute carrier family 35 protein E3
MGHVVKAFKVLYLPFWMNLKVAAFGVGSICLMNFSLQFNSIGFYQMLKLCIVPCCLVINLVTYGEWATRKVVGALVLVLFGVGVATVSDVELNAVGSMFGAAAVLVTAQYQIWQGKKQKESGLSSMQLANSVSLYQIYVGAALSIFFEGEKLISRYFLATGVETDQTGLGSGEAEAASFSEKYYLAGMISLSCLLAVSVNVHSFALIGKTSAVTFQVIGHGKTCLILLAGYWNFLQTGGELSELYVNLSGVAIALFGVVLYSNLQLAGDNGSDWCDACLPAPALAFFRPASSKNAYEKVSSKDEDLEMSKK